MKHKTLTVNLDKEDSDNLERLAKEARKTQSQWVRDEIRKQIKRVKA